MWHVARTHDHINQPSRPAQSSHDHVRDGGVEAGVDGHPNATFAQEDDGQLGAGHRR